MKQHFEEPKVFVESFTATDETLFLSSTNVNETNPSILAAILD